jgi:uncharacterized membrane protein (UPF0127 family)
VYIADTDEKRVKGLSGVEILHPKVGLAFVFDTPDRYSFWMKDMHFPLDFIYVNNGTVVDIIEDVLPDTYPDTIEPQSPASVVIELNAGQVKENSIEIGDRVDL